MTRNTEMQKICFERVSLFVHYKVVTSLFLNCQKSCPVHFLVTILKKKGHPYQNCLCEEN